VAHGLPRQPQGRAPGRRTLGLAIAEDLDAFSRAYLLIFPDRDCGRSSPQALGGFMIEVEAQWRQRRLALAALSVAFTVGAARGETSLKLVPQADLKILDTVWTTNNITSNHGYMVYDVLIAMDSKLGYRPQMVESYESSADGLTWKFTLRN